MNVNYYFYFQIEFFLDQEEEEQEPSRKVNFEYECLNLYDFLKQGGKSVNSKIKDGEYPKKEWFQKKIQKVLTRKEETIQKKCKEKWIEKAKKTMLVC